MYSVYFHMPYYQPAGNCGAILVGKREKSLKIATLTILSSKIHKRLISSVRSLMSYE